AGPKPQGPVVVFNGDVLTSVDLPALLALHRERKAHATIVLTPVDNPSAFGLVETDAEGNVTAFREKPTAEEITVNTINAGIYIIEGETLERIPAGTPYSIERAYFPSLIERREAFIAHVYRGYWIDIGTREKYQQVHTDIMTGRFNAPPFQDASGTAVVSPDARIESGATIETPCFIDAGVVVKNGARIGAHSVIGAHSHVSEDAQIDGAILWPHTWVDRHAKLGALVAGRHSQFGRNTEVSGSALLGDNSVITDFSRL
ncbi:MAG: NDP-sugar synthase, partial [Vicinamibacterales bacterium]